VGEEEKEEEEEENVRFVARLEKYLLRRMDGVRFMIRAKLKACKLFSTSMSSPVVVIHKPQLGSKSSSACTGNPTRPPALQKKSLLAVRKSFQKELGQASTLKRHRESVRLSLLRGPSSISTSSTQDAAGHFCPSRCNELKRVVIFAE
jgi:hypothetical protein